ncbi:hypothetical protein OV079_36485 [Nannocystis pusilla]|uniref:Uncharacterized protein n=1 Tax=Nannocystis pusilla TaxID=889268 RepID=A0A9X3EVE2_9BACT|nr:hypothetical protein [Nannocystis pusilla]MCY1010973.1 hypothetical protein [Nannocystis pusilla]
MAARGVISGSEPTVMPSQRVLPSKTTSSRTSCSPRRTEKKPSSKVTLMVSAQISLPATSAS